MAAERRQVSVGPVRSYGNRDSDLARERLSRNVEDVSDEAGERFPRFGAALGADLLNNRSDRRSVDSDGSDLSAARAVRAEWPACPVLASPPLIRWAVLSQNHSSDSGLKENEREQQASEAAHGLLGYRGHQHLSTVPAQLGLELMLGQRFRVEPWSYRRLSQTDHPRAKRNADAPANMVCPRMNVAAAGRMATTGKCNVRLPLCTGRTSAVSRAP